MHRRQAADISVLARQKAGSTHTNRSTNIYYYYYSMIIDKRESVTKLRIQLTVSERLRFLYTGDAIR
jgi:hypothetical protein